jgi:hypothetical protein
MYTMKAFSIVSVSIINLLIGFRYCILIYRKKIKPALAMWLFFSIAVGMSLATYLFDGNFTLWDNILNTTDLLLVSVVALFITFFGDQSSRFTRFDKGCFLGVMVITAFWLVTQTHVTTHIMIQGIMVISYFPVIRRLWNSKEITEPFSVWILLMIAPLFSLLSSRGVLATIYSVRAIVSTGILLLLMVKIKYVRIEKDF